MEAYDPEKESGFHEYKRTLDLNQEQIAIKSIQLLRRINQGEGMAKYTIGVDDDGQIHPLSLEEYSKSIENLNKMCKIVNAMLIQTNTKEIITEGKTYYYGDFDIQRKEGRINYQDIRVCVFGTADAGKSTTIGCLISGELDDGAGSARLNVLTHKHEMEKGRTSYSSYRMMGFDENNNYINAIERYRRYNPKNIVKDASKIITFIDLAGQRNFIMTSTASMCGSLPDYGMLMVNSNSGISTEDTTTDHICLLDSYNIPFFAVFTNTDRTTEQRFKTAVKQLQAILKKYNRKPFPVKTVEDIPTALKCIRDKVPVFKISNLTGSGQELLKAFIAELNSRPQMDYFIFELDESKNFFCLPISTIYRNVAGAGVILSGIIVSGTVKPKDVVYLGPDNNGRFHRLVVKSIEINFEKIKEGLKNDHLALSFSGKFPSNVEINPQRGMVLIGNDVAQIATKKILVRIKVTQHSNVKIGKNSCPSGFVGNRKVTFRILDIIRKTSEYDSDYLCMNDVCILECQLNRYIFCTKGTPVLFHESAMRASGEVLELL